MRRYVTCSKCGHRNDRTGGRRKCVNCRESLPKRRVPKHEEVLRDMPYPRFAALSVEIHGGELDACACCGRPYIEGNRFERDHDHKTGQARGITCYRCNHQLLRFHTADTLRFCLAYVERADEYHAREDAA